MNNHIQKEKQAAVQDTISITLWGILTSIQIIGILAGVAISHLSYDAYKSMTGTSYQLIEQLVIYFLTSLVVYGFSRPLKKKIQYFAAHEIKQIEIERTHQEHENYY